LSLIAKRKKRGGLAVRRANYTHRRKGVFNAQSIEDSLGAGNVRYRTDAGRFFGWTDTTQEPQNAVQDAFQCAKIQPSPAIKTRALHLYFLQSLAQYWPATAANVCLMRNRKRVRI
jgi:hypothetical protein